MAEGLQQFYRKKHRHLNSFLDNEKKKKRRKQDLHKFEKMKKLTNCLGLAMTMDIDADFLQQVFFEIVFKFGNILDDNVNRLYTTNFPGFVTVIEI